MAAPRNAAPTPNIAPFIAVAAVALGLGATALRLPGGIVTWALLIVAAWMSTPPQLTGKKDAAGYPTVGNPGEGKKMQQHRFWMALRWKLIIPGADWLLNDPRGLRDVKARAEKAAAMLPAPLAKTVWAIVVVFAALWFVVPARLGAIFALGAAAVAYTLPVDQLALLGAAPDSASWLMWPNAICLYVVLQQARASKRQYAAPYDPQPAIDVTGVLGTFKAKGTPLFVAPIAAAVSFVIGAAAVTVALNGFELAWLVTPWQVAAAGAGLAAAALVLRQMALPQALDEWRNTVAAREQWESRWLTLKVDPTPYLVSHRRFQINGQLPVLVDTFDAPATLGAEGVINMLPKLTPAVGGGYRVMALNENDTDSQGQPVPGSKSPLRVTIVAWPTDSSLDALQPDVDQSALELLIRAAATYQLAELSIPQSMLLSLTKISKDADGNPAAWQTEWSGQYTGTAVGHAARMVDNFFGVEAIADAANGVLFFGLLTDGSTEFDDDGIPNRLMLLDREARWKVRWTDVLKQGEQPPNIQHAVYKEVRLPNGQMLYCQPFMPNMGILPEMYMTEEKEKSLASTLERVPFTSVQRWDGRGDRAGERDPGAFRVIWSPEAVSLNPANIQPVRGPGAEAANWLLAASVARGFDAAKLKRPEVVSAVALTSPRDSDKHIWDITIRLYGDVTLASVKQNVQKIRNGMGAVEWIRVTSAPDGCRIYAGASPNDTGVTFARRQGKDKCIALDWEQAFSDAKVITPSGTVPTLVSADPLPKNPKVTRLVFRVPAGIDRQKIRDAKKTLMPATGNVYLEDEAGPTPDTVTLIACPEQPVPWPAPFDWDAVSGSSAVPFASGVTGEPIEWDWRLDPHLLLLGGSGSGKSRSLSNFISGALIRGCDVYLADPTKGAADFQWAAPWMKAMAVTDGEASAMMDHVYAEVKRRVDLNSSHGVGSYMDLPAEIRPPHIVVIIDEFTSLMFTEKVEKLPANATEEEVRLNQEQELSNSNRRNIGGKAGRLVREARSAGVSLILAAQELKADTIQKIPGGTSLKGNSSSLLLGKSTFGSRMSALKDAVAAPDLGDEVPRGRGLFESTAVGAQVIQSWFDAPDHEGSLVDHVAAVREPLQPSEKVDLTTMVKTVAEGPVFGRRIDAGEDGDAIEDVEWDGGEIDLGLVEMDFGGLFDEDDEAADEALPPEGAEDAPEPDTMPADASTSRAEGAVIFVGPGVDEDTDWPAGAIDVDDLAPGAAPISGDALVDVLLSWLLAHPATEQVEWISPAAFELGAGGQPRYELLEQTAQLFGALEVTPAAPARALEAADADADVLPDLPQLLPSPQPDVSDVAAEIHVPAPARRPAPAVAAAIPSTPAVNVPPPPAIDDDDLFGTPRRVVPADEMF